MFQMLQVFNCSGNNFITKKFVTKFCTKFEVSLCAKSCAKFMNNFATEFKINSYPKKSSISNQYPTKVPSLF